MRPIRRSIHFLWKATVLPIRLAFDAGELTFRAGVKVGGLPVRGTRATVRALGWKLALALVLGIAGGFVLGREVERRLHSRHHHDALDEEFDLGDLASRGEIEGAA